MNIFRLLCFAENDSKSSKGLMVFLQQTSAPPPVDPVVRKTASITSVADLGWALETLRNYLGVAH